MPVCTCKEYSRSWDQSKSCLIPNRKWSPVLPQSFVIRSKPLVPGSLLWWMCGYYRPLYLTYWAPSPIIWWFEIHTGLRTPQNTKKYFDPQTVLKMGIRYPPATQDFFNTWTHPIQFWKSLGISGTQNTDYIWYFGYTQNIRPNRPTNRPELLYPPDIEKTLPVGHCPQTREKGS